MQGGDGERPFPEKPWKNVTGEIQGEQPPAFGGTFVSSSQVESRPITGHRLGSPVGSYLTLRERLVESCKGFGVLGGSLLHVEILYFFENYALLLVFGVLNFILHSTLDAKTAPGENTVSG